jgi:hypothetical protein
MTPRRPPFHRGHAAQLFVEALVRCDRPFGRGRVALKHRHGAPEPPRALFLFIRAGLHGLPEHLPVSLLAGPVVAEQLRQVLGHLAGRPVPHGQADLLPADFPVGQKPLSAAPREPRHQLFDGDTLPVQR